MFHLPGGRAALGGMGGVVAIFFTPTATSGCTALGLCAFLFLWSNITETKRIGRWKAAPRLFASSSVPDFLSSKVAWRLAKNRPRHAIEPAGPKIDLLPNPERY